jgi:hypothetical protein
VLCPSSRLNANAYLRQNATFKLYVLELFLNFYFIF